MGQPPELGPGTVIDDRARLVRLVGTGGMGEVWAAEHLTLGIEVAVKLLSAHLATQGDAVTRFSREAKTVAKLKSPHVVQIYDHGVHEGTPYIVMELLEGETISARLERDQRLAPDEVLSLVNQACKALAQAHALGIIHRDIKPGNLFVTRIGGEAFLKVLDFGIVKLIGASALTETGSALGTASYMSPEQALASKELDYRSDLFSLAVVTYRMLTGTLPFRGDNPVKTMLAITEGKFVSPSQVRPELPRAVDAWFSRAFAREPNRRFQSARELSEALAVALEPGDFASAATEAAPTLRSTPPPAPTVSDEQTLASRTEVAGFVAPVAPVAQMHPISAYPSSPPLHAESSRSSAFVIGAIVIGVGLLACTALVLGVTWFVSSDSSASSARPLPSVAPIAPTPTVAQPTASSPELQPKPASKSKSVASSKPSVAPKPPKTAASDFGY